LLPDVDWLPEVGETAVQVAVPAAVMGVEAGDQTVEQSLEGVGKAGAGHRGAGECDVDDEFVRRSSVGEGFSARAKSRPPPSGSAGQSLPDVGVDGA
jgi:hypothetical protein